jgi:hypothetical protein
VTERSGLDPHQLIDLVLGTPDTLEAWRQVLFTWPSLHSRMRITRDGSVNLGRIDHAVHPRLEDLALLRAQTLLREHFSDLDAAHDRPHRTGPARQGPGRSGSRRHRADQAGTEREDTKV